MKKSSLFILFTFISFASFAQQTFRLNNLSLQLPATARKMEKSEALDYANKKFIKNQAIISGITNGRPEQRYKINNILIFMYLHNKQVNINYLASLKKGFDVMANGNKDYSSDLKMINGNQTLTTHRIFEDGIEHFWVYCVSADLSKSISADFIFNKEDEAEANVALEDFINHIKFNIQ